MRARPPSSVLLSVAVAIAAGVLLAVAAVLAGEVPVPQRILQTMMGLWPVAWFVDSALRRRRGRTGAIVCCLLIAGIITMLAFVLTLGGLADGLIDWSLPASMGAPVLAACLIALPLLRTSAREWFSAQEATTRAR